MPTVNALNLFYEELDLAVVPIEARHKERLQCKQGCSACCVDDITVFEVEANNIVAHCESVLNDVAHKKGMCAFLDDEGRCRIYA
ncbi:MAG: hypothetical protein HOE48_13870, partial [Candidatus Latescibacteria bacterium]|nr:hypothetical protein [Candidatus Latescibacterota bacterium]